MKAVESVRRLQKIIEIPTLVEYGIDVEGYRKSIPQMVKDGIASGSHRLNPRVPTEQELYKLYESLLN